MWSFPPSSLHLAFSINIAFPHFNPLNASPFPKSYSLDNCDDLLVTQLLFSVCRCIVCLHCTQRQLPLTIPNLFPLSCPKLETDTTCMFVQLLLPDSFAGDFWRHSAIAPSINHGVPQPLSQRSFDIEKLPICGKCIAECCLPDLWTVGGLFRFNPAC